MRGLKDEQTARKLRRLDEYMSNAYEKACAGSYMKELLGEIYIEAAKTAREVEQLRE